MSKKGGSMTRIELIDAQIEQLLFQLEEYQGYVSSSDIQEGYPPPDEIKEKIQKLNQERKRLLSYSN